MSLSPKKRKTKATLDLRLTERQQAEFFEWAEKHTLEEAVPHLLRKYKVRLSDKGISKWLERRRATDDDRKWMVTLSGIATSSRRGDEVIQALGEISAGRINVANLAIIGKMTQDALLSKHPLAFKLAIVWAEAVKALAADKRADAQKQDSDTSRDKFQFDAGKSALKYQKELGEINRSKCSEREKVERAVVLLFGRKPDGAALGVTA